MHFQRLEDEDKTCCKKNKTFFLRSFGIVAIVVIIVGGAVGGALVAQSSTTEMQTGGLSAQFCTGQACNASSLCRSSQNICGVGPSFCNVNSLWTSNGCCETNPSRRRRLSSCSGEPCLDPTHCRSSSNYCGIGAPWCNDQSTWTSACTSSTSAPVTLQTSSPLSFVSTNSPVVVSSMINITCPSRSPTIQPTLGATTSSPQNSPPTTRTPTSSDDVAALLLSIQALVTSELLIYETPQSTWETSTVYDVDSLVKAVQTARDGIASKYLAANGVIGRLNVAAFLSQAMKETIKYNVCDENNWDLVSNTYPASNACGQLGQNYANYKCSAQESMMECPIVNSMEYTAATNAKWWGAPPPLFCAPKSKTGNTFAWDYSVSCPDNICTVYSGQKGGAWTNTVGTSTAGRSDVEGCCWWGRGAIQLTGPCNIGKLNYFLGKGASDRGQSAVPFPDVDFCANPSAICSSTKYPELKWVSGLYYWMREVQAWDSTEWNYMTAIAQLATDNAHTVEANRKAFIDKVSGIVNRGCPALSCSSGSVDGASERASNFEKAWALLKPSRKYYR